MAKHEGLKQMYDAAFVPTLKQLCNPDYLADVFSQDVATLKKETVLQIRLTKEFIQTIERAADSADSLQKTGNFIGYCMLVLSAALSGFTIFRIFG